jgi:hypothetical protein
MYILLIQTFVSLTYEASDFDYPPNSKCVRADIEVTGSILKRTENNETHFTMFSSTDPKIKGVPQSFVRNKARQSGMAVYDLLTIIKKEKASK